MLAWWGKEEHMASKLNTGITKTTELQGMTLPEMVRCAANNLASAESSAEVLDARDMAKFVYDAAKSMGRIQQAKEAHDTVIVAVWRAQADALIIEAAAKRRIADEYDAAQERGEVKTRADNSLLPSPEEVGAEDVPPRTPEQQAKIDHVISQLEQGIITRDVSNRKIAKIDPDWHRRNLAKANVTDIGLTHKDVHEARRLRDIEAADPGVTQRTLDEILDRGEEPTRAAFHAAIRPQPRPPKMDDTALWLWGRIMEFEQRGILEADPADLFGKMRDHMKRSIKRLAPQIADFLREMEKCDE